MLKQAVVFFCALVVLASAFPEAPIPEKNKDQKGCYISELDKVVAFKSVTPSKASCMEYHCSKHGNGSMVVMKGCAELHALPPCVIKEDKNKTYPGCCPFGECP